MLTWQQYGKQIRLQRPAQAIVGHAAHGQRRQHDANAEVSGHQQAVFSLWRPRIEFLLPDRVLSHSHVLPQTNGAEFHISSYLCAALRT